MTDLDVESRLKEALIEKYGDKCSQCGQQGDLKIAYVFGQFNLEKNYHQYCVDTTGNYMDYEYYIYNYYLDYFESESEFLGLMCDICEIISPRYPTYQDVVTLMDDFLYEHNESELELFMELYPHTKPIISRLFRLMNLNQNRSKGLN